MKIIKEFAIIIIISFLGEVLQWLIPFDIPASIYGLVLMFISLILGIIKLEEVRRTGKFFIEIMLLMFIPPTVKLIDSWGIVKPRIAPFLIVSILSTIIVMAVSGKITQFIINRDDKRDSTNSEINNKNDKIRKKERG
jgi:Putative effector of murein hydrolase LrgA